MNLLLYGLLTLAVMGMVGTGVYKVKQWGANEVRAEWQEQVAQQREEEIQRSLLAATGLLDWRKKQKVLIQERTVYVDRIINRPVYHNVCLDADGLSCLNAAIRGESAAGCKPDGAVPAPSAVDGNDGGSSPAVDDRSR